jgi:hypothetical protein
MEFKFEEGQRLIVPGLKISVQGMVIAKTSFFDKTIQPLIHLRWLDDDAKITCGIFNQDDVERAQPGFVATLAMTTAAKAGIVLEKQKRKRPKRNRKKLKRKNSRSRR